MCVAALAGVVVPRPTGGDADLDLNLAALAAAGGDTFLLHEIPRVFYPLIGIPRLHGC
jgi:phage protein U